MEKIYISPAAAAAATAAAFSNALGVDAEGNFWARINIWL